MSLSRLTGLVLVAAVLAACAEETRTGPGPINAGTTGITAVTNRYARPNGIASGAGDINNPWSLGWALSSSNTTLQPGDTVWLLPGTYGDSTFTATKGGTSASPIVYRQHSSGRATINGRLKVSTSSHDLTFWGFEVTQFNPAAHPDWYGIESYAPGIKYINLVIHDVNRSGLIINWPAGSTEVYGSIMYNNGTILNNDHGIYVEGNNGTQLVEQSVFFNNLGYGVHGYGRPVDPVLSGIHILDNVSFNNGTICSGCWYHARGNILVGSERDGDTDIVIRENHVYHTNTDEGTGIEAGYLANGSDVTVDFNRIFGGSVGLKVMSWNTGTVKENQIGGAGPYAVWLEDGSPSYDWHGQDLFHTATPTGWYWSGSGNLGFDAWRDATTLGKDPIPDVIFGPTGDWWSTYYFAFPANKYEHGRGMIVVWNESGSSSINVSLSNYLNSGEPYKIYNVFNLTTPVATGTYAGGTVSIPLNAMAPPVPVSRNNVGPGAQTGTFFFTFIVTKG